MSEPETSPSSPALTKTRNILAFTVALLSVLAYFRLSSPVPSIPVEPVAEPISTVLPLHPVAPVFTHTPIFTADVVKREAIKSAFVSCWTGYSADAFGDDEWNPLSHTGSNLTTAGGVGYTIVDALDSLKIMGLEDQLEAATRWVRDELSFEKDGIFNTFETTIRVLGGLLSAFYLTQDQVFLLKATDLADRLLPAFETPSGVPMPMVNLARREGVRDSEQPHVSSTAEAASLQLEFKYLSHLTGDDKYYLAAERTMDVIRAAHKKDGLVPIFLDSNGGHFIMSPIRLGSRGDSYYEYLIKQYIQTGSRENKYLEMYEEAITAIWDKLVAVAPNGLLYTYELMPDYRNGGHSEYHKQDHLVCFLAGTLMMGAALDEKSQVPPRASDWTAEQSRDWYFGTELLKTCVDTYTNTKTGLAAEIVHFDGPSVDEEVRKESWFIKQPTTPGSPALLDARNILRPETVESLFMAFRLTGDQRYRDTGWKIFQAFELHTSIEGDHGFASIKDVDVLPPVKEDRMETFFLSETLKYLFLLFEGSDVLPLNRNVFNTEAHPFPVFSRSST